MKSQSVTPKPDADLKEWCKILEGDLPKPEVVPEGWFTVAEMAEKLGKSRQRVSHLMAAAYKRGELLKMSYRIPTGRGAFHVPHYKPVK